MQRRITLTIDIPDERASSIPLFDSATWWVSVISRGAAIDAARIKVSLFDPEPSSDVGTFIGSAIAGFAVTAMREAARCTCPAPSLGAGTIDPFPVLHFNCPTHGTLARKSDPAAARRYDANLAKEAKAARARFKRGAL